MRVTRAVNTIGIDELNAPWYEYFSVESCVGILKLANGMVIEGLIE